MNKVLQYPLILLLILFFGTAFSQPCGPGTPSFTVNLTGCPNCTYTSPSVSRNDTCCGSTNPNVCGYFFTLGT